MAADPRDPVDVIAELCQLQPEGVLEKIAEALGCGAEQMADAIRAARNSAFEAAAQECDKLATSTSPHRRMAGQDMARAIRKLKHARGVHGRQGKLGPAMYCTARDSYRYLWDAINGAGSWDTNGWVWVVEFRRVQPC
jgi:hypothetical protein